MKKGKCHICQKETNLTFEHIPPCKAFNSESAKSIEGDEMLKLMADGDRMPWEMDGLKYVQKQRGMGMYSLCQKCNNITGTYYGNEYVKFANTINILFPEIVKKNKETNSNIVGINIEGINPLLFAKQVLSMFCSTCPHITKKDSNVKELILNKEKRGLNPEKYKLSMFLLNEYKIGYTGYQAMFISGVGIRKIATIDAYPFGFVLEFDPLRNIKTPELDITSFFNDYECKEYNLKFGIPVLERNNIFSCDYRTKEEILKCVSENKEYIPKDN
jgi:hypothetical protein